MPEINCTPIGFVSSPFKERGDAPRQGRLTEEISTITLEDAYLPAMLGLEAGADIFVFCWFDRSDRTVLQSRRDDTLPIKGVFANRSPNRPNPIALIVSGLEALDGTPVLDIKPYSAEFDSPKK